jgi:hypothetical protein
VQATGLCTARRSDDVQSIISIKGVPIMVITLVALPFPKGGTGPERFSVNEGHRQRLRLDELTSGVQPGEEPSRSRTPSKASAGYQATARPGPREQKSQSAPTGNAVAERPTR